MKKVRPNIQKNLNMKTHNACIMTLYLPAIIHTKTLTPLFFVTLQHLNIPYQSDLVY